MNRASRWLFLLALACLPMLTGCAVYQAYVQRRAIEQATFSLVNAQIVGLDLAGAEFAVTLRVHNPGDHAVVLDRLDYSLYANDLKMLQGSTSQTIEVPPGQDRPVFVRVGLAYADMAAPLRQWLLLRKTISWKLEGLAHFETPLGVVDYPVRAVFPRSR
ncbi:MAG: LEA type 2 family protein [Candidatus Sericytochromatia bacterium]|nr:LEA type 2 family protein [Candidatus Sericytochromatia bacterium]